MVAGHLKKSKNDKKAFWGFSVGISYLSQNSSFRAKNLDLCLKKCPLQDGLITSRYAIIG
jgi:hypothetical protein